jgi:Cu(I)/Ag(I) efflux system membrane protein CusA/SilA
MIGGMVSSTLLTLIVIPAIFGLVKGFGLKNKDDSATPAPPIAPGAPREVTEFVG